MHRPAQLPAQPPSWPAPIDISGLCAPTLRLWVFTASRCSQSITGPLAALAALPLLTASPTQLATMSLARASRLAAALAASCGPLHAGAAPTPLLRQGQQLVSLAAAWGAAPARGFAASDAAGAAAASAAPPPPAAAAAARSTTAAAAPASSSPAAAAAAAAAADPLQQQLPDVYVRLDGQHVERRYTVQPKPVFAVVEVGGTQYKVTPNDVIVVEKLSGVDVNDTLRLQRVLLLGSAEETVIGRPYVPEASVTAAVEVRARVLACVLACLLGVLACSQRDAFSAACVACRRAQPARS